MTYFKPAFPLLDSVRFISAGWCSGCSFTFFAVESSVHIWTTIYNHSALMES